MQIQVCNRHKYYAGLLTEIVQYLVIGEKSGQNGANTMRISCSTITSTYRETLKAPLFFPISVTLKMH